MDMRAVCLLGCLMLVACAADSESSDPVAGPVAAAAAAPTGAASQDDSRIAHTGTGFAGPVVEDRPSAFVCRAGAFCEDFAEQGYAARWSGTFTTGGGSIDRNEDSASP